MTPDPAYRPNVGIMLLNPLGEAWVGMRRDTPDAWQMPQGGIDSGEIPREAALRELHEETGTAKAEILFESTQWLSYDLPPGLAKRSWGGKWRGQTQRWFAMRFTGTDADIRIDGPHPEFSTWRWVARTELLAGIVPFKRPVYEALLAEFEPRLRACGF